MTQFMFPLSKAHEALDEFLADDTGSGGRYTERWLADENGEPVAYLVPAKAYEEKSHGYACWLESQDVIEEYPDDAAAENGYKPWRHSPLAVTDRLLPHEPLHDPLARMFFGKPFDELGKDDQRKVEIAAVCALLRVTLDPDGQGAVPILSARHDRDEPGQGLRWKIAFVTKVPGLYVRVIGNGFFGEEWSIVTGSGYLIHHGWDSKDDAARCCEALGRVLPNTDWMRLSPDAFTPQAQEAVKAVVRKYRFSAENDLPEPDIMADPVPADRTFPDRTLPQEAAG